MQENLGEVRTAVLAGPDKRDLRLDLLRGIGQWMVYLDHIPYDFLNWFTIRNYGFSDAAEIFVFISGYSIGFAYGPAVKAGQFVAGAKRLWTRASQLYVAHIFLFLFFTAQIARTAARFDNPMYKDQFNVAQFLDRSDIMIGQALLLKYKPVNLDVLPLYIVLMLAAPVVVWGLLRRPNWTLLFSAVLYFAARYFDWNLPSFPGGTWYFNPFAWQFLFVFGIWCGFGGGPTVRTAALSRPVTIVAVAWLVFAFLIVMTWHVPTLARFVPQALSHAIYPIDKTNLDPLRLTHFLAVLVVLATCSPAGFAGAHLKVAAPADPVWSTLAPRVLLRRFAVVRRSLDSGASCRRHRRPDACRGPGHCSPGGHCLDRYMVPQPSDLVRDQNACDPDGKRRCDDRGKVDLVLDFAEQTADDTRPAFWQRNPAHRRFLSYRQLLDLDQRRRKFQGQVSHEE